MSITSIDLFAGGGGASEGIRMATGRAPVVAVNHDPAAIMMHAANHPGTMHLCESVFDVEPFAPGGMLDLLWASPDCFPAGTMVLTRRGPVAIEDVEVGTEVLTHKGRWREVTHTMTAERQLLRVRGHGHPGLFVSGEHPFWTVRRTDSWDNSQRKYTSSYSDPTWVAASELVKGTPSGGPGGGHYWATPTAIEPLTIPDVGGRGMEMSPALLWLAGRYTADGWCRIEDGEGVKTRGDIVITCGHHETDDLRVLLDCWTREGARCGFNELAWHERDTKTAHQFTASHRGLAEWLVTHFGHLAHHKTVPGWLMGAPDNLKRAFIEGLVSGDGWTADDFVELTTVSRALAVGLKVLLATVGFVPAMYRGKRNTLIEGRKVNAMVPYRLRWRHVVDASHSQHVDGEKHLFTPIRDVRTTTRTETVYNLSVSEDESYVADGIVVHNCTHFSRAKGGRPVSKKIRSLAWSVVDWAKWAMPRVICLENVPEFQHWTVLGPDNRPIKSRRGETFRKFVRALRDCGYDVEWRELVASDYGAPTSRKRLFLIARSDGRDIVWPEPTHGPGRPYAYRTAAECIDWRTPALSIFATPAEAKAWARANGCGTPRRPLAEATMRRIAEGVRRYVIEGDDPYMLNLTHGGRLEPLNEPFRTITCANRGEKALITPHLVTLDHQSSSARSCMTEMTDPLSTITTKARHLLVAPTLVQMGYGERKGQRPRALDLQAPLGTIVAGGNKHGFVQAFLVKYYGNGSVHSLNDPLHTITHKARFGLVHAFLTKFYGTSIGSELSMPMPTVTTGGGTGGGHLGLVTVTINGEQYAISDITLRMLQPRELARAQGFSDDYILTGTKSQQVGRIGNSVPPPVVEAIVRAQFDAQPLDGVQMREVA